MKMFYFVPTGELDPIMIRLSTSRKLADVPIETRNNIPFYLFESDGSERSNDVFRNYQPFLAHELEDASPSAAPVKRRAFGMFSVSATANTTTSATYDFTEDLVLRKFQLFAKSPNAGDHIKLEMFLDSSETMLLNTFINGLFVDGERLETEVIRATIPQNRRLKLTYTNTGNTAVQFHMNFIGEEPFTDT